MRLNMGNRTRVRGLGESQMLEQAATQDNGEEYAATRVNEEGLLWHPVSAHADVTLWAWPTPAMLVLQERLEAEQFLLARQGQMAIAPWDDMEEMNILNVTLQPQVYATEIVAYESLDIVLMTTYLGRRVHSQSSSSCGAHSAVTYESTASSASCFSSNITLETVNVIDFGVLSHSTPGIEVLPDWAAPDYAPLVGGLHDGNDSQYYMAVPSVIRLEKKLLLCWYRNVCVRSSESPYCEFDQNGGTFDSKLAHRSPWSCGSLRLDGFASLGQNDDRAPSTVTTGPIRPLDKPRVLRVNAACRENGELRSQVAIHPQGAVLSGYSLAESLVLRGDSTAHVVGWAQARMLPAGVQFSLSFEVHGCELFSFWVEGPGH